MIKILSFDLDGTIMKTTYADEVWLEGLPLVYSKEKNISFVKAKKFLTQEYDRIGDTSLEWYDLSYWFKRFNLKYNWRNLLKKYKDSIEEYSETSEILKQLNKKKNLIIISNARREFINIELQETGFNKYFTEAFSSTSDFCEVKKTTSFYLTICEKLGINPDEMIHVGDHIEYDFHIPRKAGINAYFLDRKKIRQGEFVVNNLNEFKEKIKDYIN